jgi:chorismate dehydratase
MASGRTRLTFVRIPEAPLRGGTACGYNRVMNSRFRIGAVSYLNTVPLVAELPGLAGDAELVFDLPSRLAERLEQGNLDVALAPSIELSRHPSYTIVSDACIACRGPVWSVKLVSRVPFAQIETIALDDGSRTSAVLVEIMLDRQYGVRPASQPLAIDADWRRAATDAVLVIGDRAMTAHSPAFPHVVDLGRWWTEWASLPFVFAVWVAKSPSPRSEAIGRLLDQARDAGLERLDELAALHAPRCGLTEEECRQYLGRNLHYRLGPQERHGLALFDRLVRALPLDSPPEAAVAAADEDR